MSKLEHDFFGRNQNPSMPKVHHKKEKRESNDSKPNKMNFNIDEDETW